ncbi:GIY-YIG nuclease family protein [Chryseobacterium sp. MFBS3-17]|uniref:GIY-YIG nuclease family protein n=1 Tax=Chryseobacterium sp. MFBS3-17 TaxID=2886689 RepID=UPI001D0E4569|nr:GIY-YIG nuclease family protein [Chryseobacterium sp. MFBS3-17]MCC2589457.1 GIY-YIG nuclease family protein [Chryseobacterium sp. MFBS3-17]
MITVYVLKSTKDGARYTGMAKDAERRLKEHNGGKNRYTKGHIPWEIVYTETHKDWSSARKREKFLKSSDGLKFLKNNGLFV